MQGADRPGPEQIGTFEIPSRHRHRLLIIDVPDASARLALCRTPPLLTETTPGALSAKLLARIDPDCIAFSLFSHSIDSHSLLATLRQLDYGGHVLALSPPLPNPRMVLAELRSYADGLRFRLVILR